MQKLEPCVMTRVPQDAGALNPKTSQVSAEDTQRWLDTSPHDMIGVKKKNEVDKALKDTPMMQTKRGLPSHVLVIESLVEKGLKFANGIDGEEDMKTVFASYEEFLNGLDAEARREDI